MNTVVKLKGVPIPRWVPRELHTGYSIMALRDGEEAAASWARKMKAALRKLNE